MSDSASDIFEKELYELSTAEATDLLNAFLDAERKTFATIAIDSVTLNYSQASVLQFFDCATQEVRRSVGAGKNIDRVLALRLAYYFGESLIRASNRLGWSIGESGFAQENHPVISGFSNGLEAAPIMIVRNLLSAVAIDGQPFSRIENAVNTWFKSAAEC